MNIISHTKILNLVKKHFPNFDGKIWQVEIVDGDNVNFVKRERNHIIHTDLIEDHLQFEKITGEIDLYHYRKPCHLQHLKNGRTRIDSLNKYMQNGDTKELSTGVHSFFQSINETAKGFDNFKKGHFIFCLTDRGNSDYHFENFGEACVKLRFIPKHRSNLIQFYKVKYLSELDKFFQLKKEIKDSFDLELKIKNGISLAPFVKEDRFKPEHEYRILFTVHMEKLMNQLAIDEHESSFLKVLEKNEEYIEMPLDNPIFQLDILDITFKN